MEKMLDSLEMALAYTGLACLTVVDFLLVYSVTRGALSLLS